MTASRFGAMVLVAAALLAAPGSVFAAGDEPDPTEPQKPATEEGRKLIKAQKFEQAIPLFARSVAADPRDAGAWNYLAYSHRKLGRYDLALEYYHKALAINPDHKGANEYLGELYLQMGKLDLAKKHLAKLKTLCRGGCEEYADLKKEVEIFEKKKRG